MFLQCGKVSLDFTGKSLCPVQANHGKCAADLVNVGQAKTQRAGVERRSGKFVDLGKGLGQRLVDFVFNPA